MSAPLKIMLLDDLARVFPVFTIRYDELNFVAVCAQSFKVGPMVARFLARRRAFYIQNNLRALVHLFCRKITARLNQNLVAFVAQPLDKLESLTLRQRVAARDLNESAPHCSHALQHFFDLYMLAARESVFAVAPDA